MRVYMHTHTLYIFSMLLYNVLDTYTNIKIIHIILTYLLIFIHIDTI